jgi:carbamoyltransferase
VERRPSAAAVGSHPCGDDGDRSSSPVGARVPDSGSTGLRGPCAHGPRRPGPAAIDIEPDGSFRLDLRYFTFQYGRTTVGRAFGELFGGPRRVREDPLIGCEFDLAASVQQVTEEVLRRLARTVLERTGERRLCLAGGVALNRVANGRLLADDVCDELWVQPAAGDAGGALGTALAESHRRGAPRAHVGSDSDAMSGALLGPACSDREIEDFLAESGCPAVRLPERELVERVAAEPAAGRVVACCQGRMEFGPRALGNRSILADPRDPGVGQRRAVAHRADPGGAGRTHAATLLRPRQRHTGGGAQVVGAGAAAPVVGSPPGGQEATKRAI